VKLAAREAGARQFTVRLRGIATTGPDLFVALQARAEPMGKSAPERARLMHASLVTGGAAAGGEPRRFMSWANPRDFGSTFYFNDVKAKSVDLELVFESAEPVWISALTVRAAPDTMVREFEHGLVLANPSRQAHTFDLAALFPGKSFHRFQATPAQDTKVNNGTPVAAKLELGPKDALFLLKD
jgi:hypothetical protein